MSTDDEIRSSTRALVSSYQSLLVEQRWDDWIELWTDDAESPLDASKFLLLHASAAPRVTFFCPLSISLVPDRPGEGKETYP